MRLALAVLFGFALAAQQPAYEAARYRSGGLPGLAPQAVGGGEAIVEVTIDARGRVEKVTPIRTTPPFTEMLIDSVRSWSFQPATDDPVGPDGKRQGRRPVASKVLVAALYRAPTLLTPTLGEQPATVAAASPDVAFPSNTSVPPYPPRAQFGGVVLIEARVAANGAVTPRVIGGGSPFDSAAMQAARQWRFFPARVRDEAETYAYLIFGFPQPVTGP